MSLTSSESPPIRHHPHSCIISRLVQMWIQGQIQEVSMRWPWQKCALELGPFQLEIQFDQVDHELHNGITMSVCSEGTVPRGDHWLHYSTLGDSPSDSASKSSPLPSCDKLLQEHPCPRGFNVTQVLLLTARRPTGTTDGRRRCKVTHANLQHLFEPSN